MKFYSMGQAENDHPWKSRRHDRNLVEAQQAEEGAAAKSELLEKQLRAESDLESLAQRDYAQGRYKEAIPYFARLLGEERGARVYQLYWLLANVKDHGAHGYENSIAEVAQWQSVLTKEEKHLTQELLLLAGKACLKEGDLAGAEQYLVPAYHMAFSWDVTSALALVEERKGEQAEKKGDLSQAFTSYQQAAAYDPTNQTYAEKIAQLEDLRVQERRRERREVRRRVTRRLSLGVAVVLLCVGGVSVYRKVWEWLQTFSLQQEEVATVEEELSSPSPQELSPSPSTEATGSPEALGKPAEKVEASSFVANPLKEQSRAGRRDFSGAEKEPRRGRAVTAAEPGIRLSDKKAGDSKRSPQAMWQPQAALPGDMYRVITLTPLCSEPRADAQIVTYLQPRMQVRVMGVTGDYKEYLKVRSVESGQFGYVLRRNVGRVQ